MTIVVLHIGGEKTGTTSLQAFLAARAALLEERHGLTYPTDGPLVAGHAHTPFVSAFLDPARVEFLAPRRRVEQSAVRPALDAWIASSRADCVVLSAEQFASRCGPAEIAAIADCLAGLETRVIYYARRQDELIAGASAECFRAGLRRGVRFEPGLVLKRHYNHALVAADWAAVFGRAAVSVRSYAAARRVTIERDFLGALNIPDDAFAPYPSELLNAGMTVLESRVLAVVNRFLLSWPEAVAAGRPADFQHAQSARRRLLERMKPFRHWSRSLADAMPARERTRILDAFAESNAEVEATWGVRVE